MMENVRNGVSRHDFCVGGIAAAVVGAVPPLRGGDEAGDEREVFQREIDAVTPQAWGEYCRSGLSLGEAEGARIRAELPALRRYEEAFDKVLAAAMKSVEARTVIPRGGIRMGFRGGFSPFMRRSRSSAPS